MRVDKYYISVIIAFTALNFNVSYPISILTFILITVLSLIRGDLLIISIVASQLGYRFDEIPFSLGQLVLISGLIRLILYRDFRKYLGCNKGLLGLFVLIPIYELLINVYKWGRPLFSVDDVTLLFVVFLVANIVRLESLSLSRLLKQIAFVFFIPIASYALSLVGFSLREGRSTGKYGDWNTFSLGGLDGTYTGTTLLLSLAITLILFSYISSDRNKRRQLLLKNLLRFLPVLVIYLLLKTGSRGSLAWGLLIYAVWILYDMPLGLKLSFLVILVSLSASIYSFLPNSVRSLTDRQFAENGILMSRGETWTASVKEIIYSPFVGRTRHSLVSTVQYGYDYASHCSYLDYGRGYGIFLMALVVVLYMRTYWLFKYIFNGNRKYSLIIFLALTLPHFTLSLSTLKYIPVVYGIVYGKRLNVEKNYV